MASEVDICNVALSHLGDDATVSSIDPPEGSAQAEHCARFYLVARDALLERHAWAFASRRAVLALLSAAPLTGWLYAYAAPAGLLKILAVTSIYADDDYSSNGAYAPEPYVLESLDDGSGVIYTNQDEAAIRYTTRITDTTRFTPLFTTTLGHLLAAFLAGPVIKGESGRAENKAQLSIAEAMLSKATVSDANQRRAVVRPNSSSQGAR